MAEFFGNNLGGAINEGKVTAEMIDEWLVLAYPGDTETQDAKRAVLFDSEGRIVKFQAQVVHRLARDAVSGETARLDEIAREMRDASKPEVPAELLADVPEPEPESDRPDFAAEIRRRVTMTDAVNRWGKPQTSKHGHLSESNKIRCPFPEHNDTNPSAWYDADGKWFCGACSKGGDVITYFAARQFGYDQSEASKRFIEVTREMASQLGWEIYKSAVTGDWEMVAEEEADPVPLPDRPEEEVAAPPDEIPAVPPSFEASEPITISDEEMMDALDFSGTIEWREYGINPGSFLGEWMQHAERNFAWAPPEFFFFVGLQAIGMAAGHHIYTNSSGDTNLNLMVTLIGSSGAGKSTAVDELRSLIARSDAAFDEDDKTGIKELPNPGSAEALISSIQNLVKTDTGGEVEVPSTAWLVVDEFADFVAKANRKGASNMKTLLQQLYDFRKRTDAPERSINWYSEGRGYRSLTDHHFTATFTTQLSSLRALLTTVDINSGFVGRIIPVVGIKRTRRLYGEKMYAPHDVDRAFNALWDRCRGDVRRPVLFTDETFAYLNSLDDFGALESGVIDDLMTRAHLFTFKIAALFAINNGESAVTIEYFRHALRLVKEFVVPSFEAIDGAAKATDVDDLATEISTWAKSFYVANGVWPTGRDMNKTAWYKRTNLENQERTVELMKRSHRLALVSVRPDEGGRGRPKVYWVIPEGEWSWCMDLEKGHVKISEFIPGGPG